MKHIIIFLAFRNFDIIKNSFESLSKYENADFFIVENFSENSKIIEEYFFTKNLKGYIQFEENAAANAINIFNEKYYTLLEEYDIITYTDGDIICHDIADTFNEILENFNNQNCIVSSCDLWLGNYYTNKNKKGLDEYYEDMKKETNKKDNIGQTGGTLLTLQKKHLYLLKDLHFIDSNIHNKIKSINGLWYRTLKNLAYHLTWDLYVNGNEYYEWKKHVYPKIWEKNNKEFKFKILI
jgi:hypothetical protein